MWGRNNSGNTFNVMGSKLPLLTQALFWIVLLKMPAHYLVTFNKANKIWGIIWNPRKKKVENVIMLLFGSLRALGYRQGIS